MLKLVGYAERLSARPGETLRFHVANATGAPVTASIVRVISADPNPAIGGIRTEPTALTVTTLAEPKSQIVPLGSYAVVRNAAPLAALKSITVIATVQPTSDAKDGRSIISTIKPAQGGLSILHTRDGQLGVTIGVHSEAAPGNIAWQTVTLANPLPTHQWHRVWATFDHTSKVVTVGTVPVAAIHNAAPPSTASERIANAAPIVPSDLYFAATADGHDPFRFNGRIERPLVFDRVLNADEIAKACAGETVAGLVAVWDFSQAMSTNRIVDTGPHGLHGELINTPTRAVCSSTWSGREHCFRHAPDQYAAIHFHDDDLDDCKWPVTHAVTLPDGFKSGAYALMLKAGDSEDNIPFFTVPPKGKATAKTAVLVSTYTYTVYGNHARPEWMADEKWRDAWIKQSADWQAYPHNPGAIRDYGLSTYNYHSDGSGIALVSWRRPMLNLRVGYITYPYPDIRGSGLRHYPADSHLLAWLEHAGHDFDLITDYELDREGLDLLKNYKTVVTGTHPEYHTPNMLDALEQYRDGKSGGKSDGSGDGNSGGGNLIYLGGNGFYWKIALDPARDGIVEIRRAEGGIRAWAAEPGEYYNQFDAEYGGLWRRNARPPQKLVGVGFTGQGNFVGSHYRIKPDARTNSEISWIFDGITSDTIGGYGFSGHGAAGFELDRADKRLGTPANAHILASSEDHPPDAPWVLVPEEQLTHLTTIPGESHKQLIRADMVYFKVPNGGQVFSTGSITFCGSLPHNGFDNDIARLLNNVISRFSA